MNKAATIRTETKPFGHVFHPNPSPCVPGWSCCMCGYFTKVMDAAQEKLVCGHVTYPVLSGQARGPGASRKSRGATPGPNLTAKQEFLK